MKEFIKRFSGLVKGTISGFDRIVFKGLVLPLMSSCEVMFFCRSRSILNKDYKQWMMTQTAGIIEGLGDVLQIISFGLSASVKCISSTNIMFCSHSKKIYRM